MGTVLWASMQTTKELILTGGRVIDPAENLDACLDVVIRDGRIEALLLPSALPTPNSTHLGNKGLRIDVSGAIITPGFIDLHGHWYMGSAYGLDPAVCLQGCVTATVDAGTSGFVNFDSFRRQSIDGALLRVRAFVNVAALGIPSRFVGELEDLRYARPVETAAKILEHRDVAVGVKVRLSGCGPNAHQAFEAARVASDIASVPIMVDIGDERDLMPGVLDRMRPGDILTHCFTGFARGIRSVNGRVTQEAWAARQRGVRFDIGHGRGSFSFAVARLALAEGFLPDSISTDLHRYSIGEPVVDLLTTMSKFLHLGMPLPQVVKSVTIGPALSIGESLPSLRPGSIANVAVFSTRAEPVRLVDSAGLVELANSRLIPLMTIIDGCIVDPNKPPPAARVLQPYEQAIIRADRASSGTALSPVSA